MKKYVQKFAHFLNGKGEPVPGSDIVEKKNIILNCKSVTPAG